MIQVHGVSKTFGTVKAVQDVSMVAPDGQITGLLGPNGAGKTTLMRMLYMVLSPDSGHIEIDGKPIADNPQETARRMGALPHAHGLYERLTSREHIHYFGELHGLAPDVLKDRTEYLIKTLEMEEIKDRKTAGFSQGQKVKVAMARALVHDPHTIILDEPTAGLDVMSVRNIRTMLRKLRDEGRCILFSSHLMNEVAELCDRVVIIAKGHIAAEGTPDDLLAQTNADDLEDAFVSIIDSSENHAPETPDKSDDTNANEGDAS